MAGDSIGSNAPTYEPRSNSNSKPVTTEPSIDPNLRTKIEAVYNSVSGHFGVEYTRKVLLGRGVDDDGLRRAVTKFVRDCPVCQLNKIGPEQTDQDPPLHHSFMHPHRSPQH